MNNEGEIPGMLVDPGLGSKECSEAKVCETYVTQFTNRMLGKYVAREAADPIKINAAVIPLSTYNAESYYGAVRKVHKGNAIREAKKAEREGFIAKLFAWSNHIPDIYEINTSKSVRSGGEMRAAYARSIEELGGPPTALAQVSQPKCPLHHTYAWGLFRPSPGYMQGGVVTDEQLLAYVKLKRTGNYAAYSSILGHGDYLQYGIMYKLHYAIMDWCFAERGGLTRSLDFLLYGAMESGGEGLQLWKKRALFTPARLQLLPGARLRA